jgi:hypothetical protein
MNYANPEARPNSHRTGPNNYIGIKVDFLVSTIDLNSKGRAQTKKCRPVVSITNTLMPIDLRMRQEAKSVTCSTARHQCINLYEA